MTQIKDNSGGTDQAVCQQKEHNLNVNYDKLFQMYLFAVLHELSCKGAVKAI